MDRRLLLLVVLVTAAARLPSQDPGEVSRRYCDDADPANRCPGVDCRCVDETLEVTFDGVSQSILEVEEPVPGTRFDVLVVMDVKSPVVGGWSYGVDHDGALLQLTEVTLAGTDVRTQEECCLYLEGEILTCKDDPDPACPNPRVASGFVSAVILSFIQPIVLEVRRNTIVRASYTMVGDPGPAGTLIQVVDYLRMRNSPRAAINISHKDKSRSPRLLVDGLVRRAEARFRRGDLDGSGRITVADAIGLLQAAVGGRPAPIDCDDLLDTNDDGRLDVADAIPLLAYLFQRGAPPPEPFLECGLDPTPADGLACAQGACR